MCKSHKCTCVGEIHMYMYFMYIHPYLDMTSEMVISREAVDQLQNKLTKLLHNIKRKR